MPETITLSSLTAKLLLDKCGKTYHRIPQSCSAVQMIEPFTLGGEDYAEGDYLVQGGLGAVAMKRAEFETQFQPRKTREKKADA